MKKLKVWSCLVFAALGGITISGCAVMPNADAAPEFEPLPDNEQDKLVNKIFDTKFLKANLDVNVAYQSEEMEKPDNYHVTGDALLDIQSLDNVGADVSLKLDMNNTPEEKLPILNFDFTYTNSTVYLDVNTRSVKLATDDFSELLELLLGSGSDDTESSSASEKTNIKNSGIMDIVTNISNMTVTNTGDHYEYVSATTGDQPNLIITSDFDFNITSLAINGIKYQDFTIDVNIGTEVLQSLDNPIVSPETAGHPYINLTNYFGALRKVRAILDDERFGMKYELALTHYETDKEGNKKPSVYLGDTVGHVDMDLANSIVDLQGAINISDPRYDDHQAYTTSYHGQYINENIYLDYELHNSNHYKLSFSHQGLNDMWDLMGDSELFGGKNIFDLLFGVSDKEYPIIDILTDATYRNLSKYGEINLDTNFIEVDVDNYLLGGKGHGSLKINLNEDRNVKNVTITSLDINSYVVDGYLSFEDYEPITPVDPGEFNSLDGMADLIRDGVTYFRSNKYNLGLDFNITDTVASESFTITGDAQVNVHPKDEEHPEKKTGYDGYADLTINDFDGNIHTLKANANPKDGETNVYAMYSYKAAGSPGDPVELKLKASRDSVSALFDQLMGYDEEKEEVDIMKMLEPYIVDATHDTLERIFHEGDYFSILRDETIKSVSISNHHHVIVLSQESFGVKFGTDITIDVGMSDDDKKISSINITTKYDKYDIDLGIALHDNTAEIPELTDKEGYIPIDQFTDIFMNKEVHLDLNANINKIVSGTPQDYVEVKNCQIDANIRDKANDDEDLWDRLYAKIGGEVRTSGESVYTSFLLGYDQNLSLKFGDEAKITVTRENVRDTLDRAKNVMPKSNVVPAPVTPTTETEVVTQENTESNIDMFLKIMDMLSEGSYADFLNKIKSTSLTGGTTRTLTITVDNSLFREGDTTDATIAIRFNDQGIVDISVTNFRYDSYALSGTIALANRTRTDVDVTGYNEVYNIVDAVLNTATPKDIVISGQIKMNATLVGLPTGMNRTFTYNAFIHKEDDGYGNESVYGYLRFSSVPFLFVGTSEDGVLSYKVSDNRDVWKDGSRTFELYFASTVNYDEEGHTIPDGDNEVSRTSTIALKAEYTWNSTTKIKEKFITSDDFMSDMTYYLLNYGLGIKAKNSSLPNAQTYYGEDDLSTNSDDFLNFHNYEIDNNYTPNLSTLLKSYDYSPTGADYASSIYSDMEWSTDNECWVITIDGGNLLNNDMIKDVELFTNTGITNDKSYLEKAIVTTKVTVAGVATLTVGMTADHHTGDKPSTSQINKVKNYIGSKPVGYRRYNDYNNLSSLTA